MNKKPDYLPYAQTLWLADLIEDETTLSWQQSKRLAQRIVDEIDSTPDLFGP